MHVFPGRPRRAIRRQPLLALFCGLVCLTLSHRAGAHAGGVSTEGCGGCHNGGKPATVTVTANPTLLGVGQMTTLTIAVSQTNGATAGFYLSSNGVGRFTIVDSGTKLLSQGVTQSTPRAGAGGTTSFQVGWTAPSTPGGVAFSVWANSANGDGRSGGDGEGVGFLSTAFGCAGSKYYRDADGDGSGAEASGY